jgi:hypothetical protein
MFSINPASRNKFVCERRQTEISESPHRLLNLPSASSWSCSILARKVVKAINERSCLIGSTIFFSLLQSGNAQQCVCDCGMSDTGNKAQLGANIVVIVTGTLTSLTILGGCIKLFKDKFGCGCNCCDC